MIPIHPMQLSTCNLVTLIYVLLLQPRRQLPALRLVSPTVRTPSTASSSSSSSPHPTMRVSDLHRFVPRSAKDRVKTVNPAVCSSYPKYKKHRGRFVRVRVRASRNLQPINPHYRFLKITHRYPSRHVRLCVGILGTYIRYAYLGNVARSNGPDVCILYMRIQLERLPNQVWLIQVRV